MGEQSELLFAAIEKGDKAEVTRLIKEWANSNSKDAQGRTALILASANGDSEIIKTLISKGAKVDAKDEQWRTVLTRVVSLGKVGAARMLEWACLQNQVIQ
ncbi:MAG: ankyrin repeat domain-containing protein [Candidatus Micrarchaeaceae archaeon]